MIQWPYPMPGPFPVPGPLPVPGPTTGPGGGVTDVPGGDINVSDPMPSVDTSTAVSTAIGTPVTMPSLPSTPATAAGPAQVGDWKQFLIWIGALAALWLILTAMQDAGYPQIANGLAGLILFGAILAMGPKSITNAKLIFQ